MRQEKECMLGIMAVVKAGGIPAAIIAIAMAWGFTGACNSISSCETKREEARYKYLKKSQDTHTCPKCKYKFED